MSKWTKEEALQACKDRIERSNPEQLDEYMEQLEFSFMVFGASFEELWNQYTSITLAIALQTGQEPRDVIVDLLQAITTDDVEDNWTTIRDEWFPQMLEQLDG